MLLLTLNITSLIFNYSQAYSASSEFVILFDEAHGQFFTFSNMETAYQLLNKSGDYEVRRLTGNQNITRDTLSSVEILVISAPDKNSSNNYSIDEMNYIVEFVLNGGSLFLLNNPNDSQIYLEFNYTNSNVTFMNSILSNLSINNIRFLSDIIKAPVEGFSWVKNRYQMPLTDENLNSLSTISLGIDSILIFSTAITCTDTSLIVGTTILGSETNPSLIPNPYWLIAKDFQSGGRLVACGSMQMFSELLPYNLTSKWIAPVFQSMAFQNSKLWMNIFSWLSQENNTIISSVLFLIISIGTIGVCAILIYRGKKQVQVEIPSEVKEKIESEKDTIKEEEIIEDISLMIEQRAKILKSARFFIKNRNYLKASEYYKKAAQLTKSIDDDKNLYDIYMKKSKKYQNYNK